MRPSQPRRLRDLECVVGTVVKPTQPQAPDSVPIIRICRKRGMLEELINNWRRYAVGVMCGGAVMAFAAALIEQCLP